MTGNVCSFVVMYVTVITIWWMKKIAELIVPTDRDTRRQRTHVISERVHPVVFFRR
jgi:hypothetical protein